MVLVFDMLTTDEMERGENLRDFERAESFWPDNSVQMADIFHDLSCSDRDN